MVVELLLIVIVLVAGAFVIRKRFEISRWMNVNYTESRIHDLEDRYLYHKDKSAYHHRMMVRLEKEYNKEMESQGLAIPDKNRVG